MIFVSSPYSSPLSGPAGRLAQHSRFEQVRDLVLHIAATEGLLIYSPIVYCHDLAIRGNMPTDAQFWLNFNMTMLRRAEALFNLRLPGWENSKGVTLELETAKVLGIPVFHFTKDFERMDIQ
jgi:hypothetical protein